MRFDLEAQKAQCQQLRFLVRVDQEHCVNHPMKGSETMNKFDIDSAPKIWVQTGHEKSAQFVFNLTRRVRSFMLAMTGGCGYMSAQDGQNLKIIEEALKGYKGFTINAATQMRSLDDPETIVPSINDVFPNIKPFCPESVMLGIAIKQTTMRMSKWGVVVSDSTQNRTFTVIPCNTQLDAILLYQPGVDTSSPWETEWKERTDLVGTLVSSGWKSLLLVYNGGKITESEVRCWAKHGKSNPDSWPVVLIRGSGRIADTFADDTAFLDEHPSVHVADLEIHSIRSTLHNLGAFEST